MQTQSTIFTRSRGQSAITVSMFFFKEATVLFTSKQWCACQEMQSLRGHVTSFDRCRDSRSRVTERSRPSRNDDRFQSSQMTALLCARRLNARQGFIPAYRTPWHVRSYSAFGWLNLEDTRQKIWRRSHSPEGVQTVGCASVQSFGNAWVHSGGCLPHHHHHHAAPRRQQDR